MANADSTEQSYNNQLQHFKYSQLLWGDLIYGTKDQLQSIGIAVGMPFPGESCGAKRILRVLDPRGFRTKIEERIRGEGIYCASISFPGRERDAQEQWDNFTAGVLKRNRSSYSDEYIGTADALIAAGLVRDDQLPGKPGMRKMRVTILPDGTVQMGATSNCSEARNPGAKWIEMATKTTYRVCVILQKNEEQLRLRREESNCAKLEWETRMRALPRPAPLIVYHHPERASETTPSPMYRVDGNVIHILSMAGSISSATF